VISKITYHELKAGDCQILTASVDWVWRRAAPVHQSADGTPPCEKMCRVEVEMLFEDAVCLG